MVFIIYDSFLIGQILVPSQGEHQIVDRETLFDHVQSTWDVVSGIKKEKKMLYLFYFAFSLLNS